jgi:hypothetical protein
VFLHDPELAGEDGNRAELFLLLPHQLSLVLGEPDIIKKNIIIISIFYAELFSTGTKTIHS